MDSLTLAHELVGDLAGVLSGRVRLSAPVGMAEVAWATISKFLTLHPGVRIEMELADRYVDLVEERFDLAIRSGAENRGEKLIGRRLHDAPRSLFASPAYLKSHGVPRTVADLKRHDCVILGAHVDRATWQIHIGKRIQNVVVQGRVAVNEARVAAQCAAEGFGIAFLPSAVCVDHVEASRLKRILPRAGAGQIGLWLVYPDRHLPAATRALAEHLVRELPASLSARMRI